MILASKVQDMVREIERLRKQAVELIEAADQSRAIECWYDGPHGRSRAPMEKDALAAALRRRAEELQAEANTLEQRLHDAGVALK